LGTVINYYCYEIVASKEQLSNEKAKSPPST